MKRRVLITTSSFGQFDNLGLEKLKNNDLQAVGNPYKRKLTEEELLNLLEKEKPVGLIAGTEPVTANILQRVSEYLRVISRVGAGWDNVDHETAALIGAKVYRTPDATTQTVAELTLGLILGLLRKINQMNNDLKSGIWKKKMGNLLENKKVGIIGFGRIGRRLAELLAPFNVEIGYQDIQEITGVSFGKQMNLDELLSWADIVTLHVSTSIDNNLTLDEEKLKLMKKGAWLINTSRGGVVDEEALFNVLNSGDLSGAAIDVFKTEPYQGPLVNLDNVIITPHIGSYAQEARIRMETEAIDNLIEGLRIV